MRAIGAATLQGARACMRRGQCASDQRMTPTCTTYCELSHPSWVPCRGHNCGRIHRLQCSQRIWGCEFSVAAQPTAADKGRVGRANHEECTPLRCVPQVGARTGPRRGRLRWERARCEQHG
eukprot:scaffold12711_cov120-Isochrysis_galbana.AAC.3